MFNEFDNLQTEYRNEANQWLADTSFPDGFEDLPYQDKIHFVISDVKDIPELSMDQRVQMAYHRSCLVLGDQIQKIESGNFNKPIMRYFLQNKNPDFSREESSQRSSVMSRIQRVVLGHQFGRDTDYIFDFADILDKPAPKLDEIYDQFLAAGETKELIEVILHQAKASDGKPTGPIREFVINDIVASLVSRLVERSDVDASDLKMLVDKGQLTPKPLHESDFYLDNIVPPVDDRYREIARNRIGMNIQQDSPFWDIKEKMSDKEVFNYLLPRAEKTKTMDNWTVAMAGFEEITGKSLSIREAIALNPGYGFNLASTRAFQDRLDQVGTNQSHESFRNVGLAWEDEGYDDDGEIYQSSITLESSAFLIQQVSEKMESGSMGIPEIRYTTAGADFVTYEFEFDSQQDMIARRKDIRLELKRLFMDAIKDVPLPGDSVEMTIPEGYDEDDVNTDSFKVGDKGVVSAVGYFGGNQPACKIRGVYGYQDPEHLLVTNRPKNPAQRFEKEPEPQ